MELVIASVAVAGVVVTGIGLVITWRRNGTHQARRDLTNAEDQAARDAVAETNQKAIIERLDDKDFGLQAVNIKITSVTERVTGHDREIRELKSQRKT